jgi:signal peptidase II
MLHPTFRLAAVALVVASTVGCDRVTKHMASTLLAGKPTLSFLGDTLRLGYAENAGGFLSLGAKLPALVRTGIFTVAAGAILLVLLLSLLRSRWSPWRVFGVTLFLAGGLSNWIDRLFRGSVVDFLNVGVGWLRTGIFNFADVAIMLGIALVVLAELADPRRDEQRVGRNTE